MRVVNPHVYTVSRDEASVEPPPTGPIFNLRIAQQTALTSTRIVTGTLDLTEYLENGNTSGSANPATIDETNVVATIEWPGISPPGGLEAPQKLFALRKGGGQLGPNSLAAAVESNVSSKTIGGQSELKIWDSGTETFTTYQTPVVGRRFRQPVLDQGLWWFVEYDVDTPFEARLMSALVDLSVEPEEVSSTGITSTSAHWNLFVSTDQVYSPIYVSSATTPSECWRFPRGGGPPARESFALLQFASRNLPPSAMPLADGRPFHSTQSSSGLGILWGSLNTSTRIEQEISFGLPPGVKSWRGLAAMSRFPTPFSEIIISSIQGIFGSSQRLIIYNPLTAVYFPVAFRSPQPSNTNIQQVWIEG